MMDASEEIPQRVQSEQEPSVLDIESRQHSPTSMPDMVSKVLDDDNLLREILLRVSFPSALVRAATVCRRWLHHASIREFLRRFRDLHPPHLLGFYLNDVDDRSVAARFFPMLPQPPELATVVRRANFNLDHYQSIMSDLMGCQNGRVLVNLYDGSDDIVGVHSPLHHESGLVFLPPFPQLQIQDGYFCALKYLLHSAEDDGGLSYLYVLVESNRETAKSTAYIHMLQHGNGVWRKHHTLATDQLLVARWEPNVELADNKIFIASLADIVVLNLTASSISRIQLPQGVEYGDRDTRLARADDASGVYLIHAKELQLRIWLHKGDNWLLVDTICLHEMCANLGMLDHMVDGDPDSILRINHFGDYADFVFLEIRRCILHLDVKCRQLRKVYELPEKQRCLGDVRPFMTIWPPTFPALKDDPARNAM